MSEWVIIGCLATIGVLLLLIIRLSIHVGKVEGSIAKLGYVIREDAKKYFDDAAHVVVDVNEKFQDRNREVVRDGTQAALTDAGVIMEQSLKKAHEEAGAVVLEAREEARRIIASAKDESETYRQQALDQSATTIRWTLEQYVSQVFTVEQHEELIKGLVDQHSQGRGGQK